MGIDLVTKDKWVPANPIWEAKEWLRALYARAAGRVEQHRKAIIPYGTERNGGSSGSRPILVKMPHDHLQRVAMSQFIEKRIYRANQNRHEHLLWNPEVLITDGLKADLLRTGSGLALPNNS
jgi:hypothetical protein